MSNSTEQKVEQISKETIDLIHKEILMIQDIIKRMASNSFLIKGWTVTLIVITFVIKKKGVEGGKWIPFIPLISFWYLDAFFLYQERLYRNLYKWVLENRPKSEDFLFDLNAYRIAPEETKLMKKLCSVCSNAFSFTLFIFYGAILILVSLSIYFT